MDLHLQGKVVIVTGAGRGIGRATALAFAREGAKVVCLDLQGAEAVAGEIRMANGEALGMTTDVTQWPQIVKMRDDTLSKYGRIDALINNAGLLREAYLHEMDEAIWDVVINVNLKGVFLCSKAVAPVMIQQRAGRIINASSFAAIIPSAGHGAYAAAKLGVIALTKTLAGELGPYGIRAIAYVPGVIATELTRELRTRAGPQMLSAIPVGRFGDPQDVANVLVFLASEQADYINGAVVEISGGKLCVQNVEAAKTRAQMEMGR